MFFYSVFAFKCYAESMKNSFLFIALAAINISPPAYSEEASNKEGIKNGAETVVNGTALIGVVGSMSEPKPNSSYDGRKGGAKTWKELGDMHRAARPGVADFGK